MMMIETRKKYQTIDIKLIDTSNSEAPYYSFVYDHNIRKSLYIVSERIFLPLPLNIFLFKKVTNEEVNLWTYFSDKYDNDPSLSFKNNVMLVTDVMSGLTIRRHHVQVNSSWK